MQSEGYVWGVGSATLGLVPLAGKFIAQYLLVMFYREP